GRALREPAAVAVQASDGGRGADAPAAVLARARAGRLRSRVARTARRRCPVVGGLGGPVEGGVAGRVRAVADAVARRPRAGVRVGGRKSVLFPVWRTGSLPILGSASRPPRRSVA